MIWGTLYCPLLRSGKEPFECLEKECAWWADLNNYSGCALKVAVELFEEYLERYVEIEAER